MTSTDHEKALAELCTGLSRAHAILGLEKSKINPVYLAEWDRLWAEANAAVTILKAVSLVPTWQPIETAPRDGKNILLCIDGGDLGYKSGTPARVIGYWAKKYTIPAHDDVTYPERFPGLFEYCEDDGDYYAKAGFYVMALENQYGDEIAKSVTPSHWMPLPPAPDLKSARSAL